MKRVACERPPFTRRVGRTVVGLARSFFLLRLDTQSITADRDFLVRLHHDPLFARSFTAGNQRRISSFWSQPVTPLIVEGERRMNTTDLRVAFERQINRD